MFPFSLIQSILSVNLIGNTLRLEMIFNAEISMLYCTLHIWDLAEHNKTIKYA